VAKANYLPTLESEIEHPVVTYYRKKYREYDKTGQPLVRKMNGMGYRSWCDRLFLGPWGRTLWIEFKAPDKKPSDLQTNHHVQLRAMGHTPNVVDKVEDGKRLIDALFCDTCPKCEGLSGWFYNIELCDDHARCDILEFELVQVGG
jgi:hypothetical protein